MAFEMNLPASASTASPQPSLIIGGGGGGGWYFSGPATYLPYSLHGCTETSYDLSRFGPIDFCASGGTMAISAAAGIGVCIVSGALTVYGGSDGMTDFSSAGRDFSVGCVGGELLGFLGALLVNGATQGPSSMHHVGSASFS
jgi:hypothetical protein